MLYIQIFQTYFPYPTILLILPSFRVLWCTLYCFIWFYSFLDPYGLNVFFWILLPVGPVMKCCTLSYCNLCASQGSPRTLPAPPPTANNLKATRNQWQLSVISTNMERYGKVSCISLCRPLYLQRKRLMTQRTLAAECIVVNSKLLSNQSFLQEPVERKVEIPDVGTELLICSSYRNRAEIIWLYLNRRKSVASAALQVRFTAAQAESPQDAATELMTCFQITKIMQAKRKNANMLIWSLLNLGSDLQWRSLRTWGRSRKTCPEALGMRPHYAAVSVL